MTLTLESKYNSWKVLAICGYAMMVSISTTCGQSTSTSTSVCSRSTSYEQYYQETYQASYSQRYSVSCEFWNLGSCTRHRTAYRSSYRNQHRTAYRTSYSCCQGWSTSGSSCTPVCSPGCANGGTCTRPNVCQCPSGYTGNRCQTPVCSPVCANSGTCTRPNVCQCPSSYTGNRCQTPVCSPGCANGGRCTSPNVCQCPSGYTGNRCQTPVCSPGCANGGTCTRPNVCQCQSGYTGNRCQTPVCSPNCLHGGVCVGPNICNCASGFTGTRCQLVTNTCPNDITVPNGPGEAGASVSWTDVISVNADVNSTHSTGGFFLIGSTVVTYSIMNATVLATCSFTVTVQDVEQPNLSCPSNFEGFADSGNTAVPVHWPLPAASDNSGNAIRIMCSSESGSDYAIGDTVVQCQAFDSSKNKDTCEFQVIIQGRCLEDATNTNIGRLSWESTVAGHVAESIQRCPVNSERRNYGLASRECLSQPAPAVWAVPQVNACGGEEVPTIIDLAQVQVTSHNVEDVAETLANITNNSDGNDIITVQETMFKIVNAGSSSPKVTEAVVEVVDHILGANNTSTGRNASTIILKSIEQQIAQTLTEHQEFSSVQPNIVVEAFSIRNTETRGGVGLAVLTNNSTDDSFKEGVVVNFDLVNKPLTETIASLILLHNDIFGKNESDTKVSFVVYNEDKLFQSRRLAIQNSSLISGPIISATVIGETVVNLTQPVVVQIFPTKIQKSLQSAVLNTSVCVFWDFNQHGGIGDWSEDGCERISTSSGRITCHCNHLTNFAVLMDVSGQHSKPNVFDFALDIISKIGCAFSIVGLSVTLLVFLTFRRLQNTLPRKILIQLCISMLGLYIVFLVGIDTQSGSKGGCIAVAAFLHYFVLTTVLWMGVEARHMYITLVTVFTGTGSKFMIKASCFAWGLPLIPVGVVLSVTWTSYIPEDAYCFLTPDYGLYFGLLLPVAMVILYNIVTFALVMRKILKSNLGGSVSEKSKVNQVTTRLQNAFTISILLGLTWVFGFLAVDRVKVVFQLLFCVCNSFQGVLVFTLFCIRQDDVRKTVMAKCFGKCHDSSSSRTDRSNLSTQKIDKSEMYQNNRCYESELPEIGQSSTKPNQGTSASKDNANQEGNIDDYESYDYPNQAVVTADYADIDSNPSPDNENENDNIYDDFN